MRTAVASSARLVGVRVLDADPELATHVAAADAAEAARRGLARVAVLDEGPWCPPPDGSGPGALGILILDGVLARSVCLAGRTRAELVGAGDVIGPREQDDDALVRWNVAWSVVEPGRAALLDRRFAAAVAPWPEIAAAIVERALGRAQRQGLALAVAAIPRVDLRLLVVLWHLADRWGRVATDGVVVPIRLTHELLAALVAARRPSVTTALTGLTERGIVTRRENGSWVLRPAGRTELERLCGDGARAALPHAA